MNPFIVFGTISLVCLTSNAAKVEPRTLVVVRGDSHTPYEVSLSEVLRWIENGECNAESSMIENNIRVFTYCFDNNYQLILDNSTPPKLKEIIDKAIDAELRKSGRKMDMRIVY